MKKLILLALFVASSALAQVRHPLILEIEYAEPANIPYVCAARGAKFNQNTTGCQYWLGKIARIVIPFGGKYSCVYWHELRHVYEGDWHAGRKSYLPEGCDWRPPQG